MTNITDLEAELHELRREISPDATIDIAPLVKVANRRSRAKRAAGCGLALVVFSAAPIYFVASRESQPSGVSTNSMPARTSLAATPDAGPATTAQDAVLPTSPAPTKGRQISTELDMLPLGAPNCHPASPQHGGEIRGTASGGTVYGLIFGQIKLGEEFEVAWKISGGPAKITVFDPVGDESTGVVTFGPEYRVSNYPRPGEEVAYAYRFDSSGCWHFTFERRNMTADVWIRVE